MSLARRFRDWCHERDIQRLAASCKEACTAGDKAKARHFWQAMGEAIRARSPGQIARMERAAFRRMAPEQQRFFLKHGGSAGAR